MAMQAPPKRTLPFIYFTLIIFLISLSDVIVLFHGHLYSDLFINFALCLSLFLLPVYLFRKRLTWYYWLLYPFILLSSIAVGCFIYFNVRLNPDVVLLAVNTNFKEATELGKGDMPGYLSLLLITLVIYIFLARKLPSKLPAGNSLYISLISAIVLLFLPFINRNGESCFTRLKAGFYSAFPTSFLYSAGKVYTFIGICIAMNRPEITFVSMHNR